MTIKVRQVRKRDLDSVVQLFRSAFQTSSIRVDDFRRYLRLEPHTWLLAEDQGHGVGMTAAWHFAHFSYVGAMAVRKTMQKRGIGGLLMQRLLADLDDRRCPMVLLDATPAGEPLYRGLGFHIEDESLLFRLEKQPEHRQHDAIPLATTNLDELGQFDAAIYGTNRRNLLDIWCRDFGHRGFVTRDDRGYLTGYALAQMIKIGPWVARHEDAAQQLLHAIRSLKFDGKPEVIIPGKNESGQQLLRDYGFVKKQVAKHMRRGGVGLTSQRAHLYGQTSFALG